MNKDKENLKNQLANRQIPPSSATIFVKPCHTTLLIYTVGDFYFLCKDVFIDSTPMFLKRGNMHIYSRSDMRESSGWTIIIHSSPLCLGGLILIDAFGHWWNVIEHLPASEKEKRGYNYRDYAQFPSRTVKGNMEVQTCAEQQYAIKTFSFVARIVFGGSNEPLKG